MYYSYVRSESVDKLHDREAGFCQNEHSHLSSERKEIPSPVASATLYFSQTRKTSLFVTRPSAPPSQFCCPQPSLKSQKVIIQFSHAAFAAGNLLVPGAVSFTAVSVTAPCPLSQWPLPVDSQTPLESCQFDSTAMIPLLVHNRPSPLKCQKVPYLSLQLH